MKRAFVQLTNEGASMKKTVLLVVLVVALTFAFATSAYATSGKFWNYQTDYYSWGSYAGNGYTVSSTLGEIGANAANPGVHANYLVNTAKCGICHSVHRAKAGGVKLLNSNVATCAGCHRAGTSTVTNVVVSWQTGGPHSSGTDASCNSRGCHLNSPHGVGGSQYALFSAKLLNNVTDLAASGAKVDLSVADAVANPVASGITTDMLDAVTPVSNSVRQAIVVGYTCNSWGCHEQSMLPVINAGYAEDRLGIYPETDPLSSEYLKTGHITGAVAADSTSSWKAVAGCTSCHDQTDASTRTGFTFPHSETAFGASNTGAGVRAYLWMTVDDPTDATAAAAMGAGDKAFDGACLKCHRNAAGSGVGLSF
jgi:predicted CXXCH cytochrome family protein